MSGHRLIPKSQTKGDEHNPPRLVAEAISFACLGANRALPEQNGLINTYWEPFECVNGLRAQIHFPTCWNGLELYKTDGSHVTHLSQIDNGVCPPGHPKQLPHIFLETLYSVDSIPGDTVSTYIHVFSFHELHNHIVIRSFRTGIPPSHSRMLTVFFFFFLDRRPFCLLQWRSNRYVSRSTLRSHVTDEMVSPLTTRHRRVWLPW